MTRTAALPALAIALLLLPMTAADQHAYHHRYVVEGRLVGADALPLPGREVALNVSGETLDVPCTADGQQEVTDEWGDFRFCFVKHTLRPGSRMAVAAANASSTVSLDVTFRRAYVPLRDMSENGTAPPAWNETYRITGRAWRPGPVEVEGTTLIGVAAEGVPVNLTLVDREGIPTTQDTTSDVHGDFAFTLVLPDPGNTTIMVEIGGREQAMHLDPTFHRSHAPFLVPQLADLVREGTPPAGVSGGRPAPPGSTTPSMSPVLLVAVAALALGSAWWFLRKAKQGR